MYLSDYIADVQEILHDTTAVIWPPNRVISRINEARLDVGRDMHCIRQNVTGVQLIPGQEIYPLNGAVCGATVTSGGSNYGTGTLTSIFFDPPFAAAGQPPGVQALGFGNLTNGSLTSITMTQWGSGYTKAPGIKIGGIGSGAAATAVTLFRSNPLSSVIGNPLNITKISYIWNSQRRTLLYQNFTLFDAYARAWATTQFNAPPGVWSHHQQAQQVYIQPPPDQQYISEWDVIFMPAPLVVQTDFDTDLVDPWARAVQFKASELLLNKLRNMGQVQTMAQKYDAFVPHVITTSGGIRIPNIYNRNFQRRVMR